MGPECRKGDAVLELSAREFKLLRYFIEHCGAALSRDELLNEVWGYNAIAVHANGGCARRVAATERSKTTRGILSSSSRCTASATRSPAIFHAVDTAELGIDRRLMYIAEGCRLHPETENVPKMANELFAELRKRSYKEMLTADLNYRYWGRISTRYGNRDKRAKVLIAITSSGTVASWGIWSDIDLLWKGLSMSSAVVGVSLPILNWAEMSRNAAELQGIWFAILKAYEELWPRIESRDVTTDQLQKELSAITTEEKRTVGTASRFEHDEALASACQGEVLRSRGLLH